MMFDIDWGEAWREEQKSRRRPDDANFWDMRAPSFDKTCGTSPYAQKFLDLAKVEEGETVFDMGCGSGTLALPLARSGHHVYAADFSRNMLDLMMRRAELDGVAGFIHPMLLSWDDDWRDIDIPTCDLAFASRSIATEDLEASLVKLDSIAHRRACITLTTGLSPRVDGVLLEAMGRGLPRHPDCIFGFNILWNLGFMPDFCYIDSRRASEYASFDEAIDKNCEIMEANPEERERLIAYSKEHLRPTKNAEGVELWEYDHQRVTSWAFMSWNKQM